MFKTISQYVLVNLWQKLMFKVYCPLCSNHQINQGNLIEAWLEFLKVNTMEYENKFFYGFLC